MMQKHIYLAVIVIQIISFASALAVDTEGVLSKIRANYPPGKVLKADYTRETFTRIGTVLGESADEVASGTIYFSFPKRLRIEQESPQKEVLLSDGEKITWHILPKDEVHIYDFKSHGASLETILSVFQGMKGLEGSFDFDLRPEGSGHTLKMRPTQTGHDFEEVIIRLDERYWITELSIKNLAGGITRFSFKDQKFLAPSQEQYFKYTLPEGVKIIKEP